MNNIKTSWMNILPISKRFIKYALYYDFGKAQKLKLVDILDKDLNDNQLHKLELELALEGYKLNLISGHSKHKIMMGEGSKRLFSYFELVPSDLKKELEYLIEQLRIFKIQNANQIDNLENDHKIITDCNKEKSGAKALDYKIASIIFNLYGQGKSMCYISNYLNSTDIKPKHGNKWYRSSLRYILQNYQYVEKGFISEENFKNIQFLLKSKRKSKLID